MCTQRVLLSSRSRNFLLTLVLVLLAACHFPKEITTHIEGWGEEEFENCGFERTGFEMVNVAVPTFRALTKAFLKK